MDDYFIGGKMSDEVIKRDDHEDEIDLVDLLRTLKRRSGLIIVIILAVTIISIVAGVLKYNSSKSVNAIIAYNFNEISEGLNPDGTKFNSNLIFSNEVLNQVLDDLNINENQLNVVELRQNLSMAPIIPSYIQTRIKADLEEGIKTSFNPTAYEIKLDIINSVDETKKILQTLITEFSKYYSAKYGKNDVIAPVELGEDYEYQDTVTLFDGKLKNIELLLSSKPDQGFISKRTGIGFKNIYTQIELIRKIYIDKINEYLEVDGLAKNPNVAIRAIDYQIEQLRFAKQKKISELEALNGILKLYEPKGDNVVVSGAMTTVEENPNEYYSTLIEQAAAASIEVGNIEQDIKKLDDRRQRINEYSKQGNNELENEIINLIKETQEKLNEVIVLANNTLAEYDERFVSNYIKNVSPVDEFKDRKNASKIVIIGIVLGLFLGIFAAFIFEFFSKADINKKKK